MAKKNPPTCFTYYAVILTVGYILTEYNAYIE